jgi:phosphoglycerate dehydrogenase-like enzyme
MNIVIPDQIKLSVIDRKKLESYANIKIYDDIVNDPKIIIDRIKDAEIITAYYIDITEEIITASPNLKYIISPAVGADWIDCKCAREHDIAVVNCPTFNTYAAAEHTIALIFAVYRHLYESQQSILRGEWNPMSFVGTELRGKKLLSIGYGNIGKSVVKIANGIGMHTKYADSKTSEIELNQMIKDADVVVLCYPLNDKTKGSFDAHKIALLKESAILINVARGLILDQETLYLALKNKKILGAGLDVFNADEILFEGRQDIIEFARLSNVVATPHIAFNTHETKERLGGELMKNIDAILDGNPINIIN